MVKVEIHTLTQLSGVSKSFLKQSMHKSNLLTQTLLVIVRLKIDVNGEEVYSNYPKDMDVPAEEFENLRDMTPE